MTRMTPLLERNGQFASTYTPGPLGPPTAQVLIITCLDHRVDPAITLGLQLGEAPVIRNAGGRVTRAVIDDLAYLVFLAEQLFGGQDADGPLFEVDRSDHQDRRRQGKSDPLDAVSAARAAQSGRARGAPKGRDGAVEAIRALMVAKRSARSERTQTSSQGARQPRSPGTDRPARRPPSTPGAVPQTTQSRPVFGSAGAALGLVTVTRALGAGS